MTAFEEYRYDALGRRVLVRSRRQCSFVSDRPKGECSLDLVRRTVWDGEQEVVEIQMPDSQAERDTGFVALPPTTLTQGTQYFDPNPYFGRVLYTHGLALDHPVSITRVEYTDDPQSPVGPGGQGPSRWEPLSIVPIWNDRGKADLFYFAESGEGKHCRVVMSIERCVRGSFPFAWFAYDRSLSPAREWHGTLVEDKEDKSGTLYRRARYYEPTTGRFTQEDPIGLAGGMNLYGFAGGDPVNYADPFGLWPDVGALLSGARDWLYHSETGQLVTAIACIRGCVAHTAEAAQVLADAEMRFPVALATATGGSGRAGRQARLRELADDPNVSSADRGWIKQEMNSIERGKRTNIRNPPGKVLAHRRGFEAREGFSYKFSDLQDVVLHKLQHLFEGYK